MAGADVNKSDNESIGNNSPMHLAAELNMLNIITMFINCGGDPEV